MATFHRFNITTIFLIIQIKWKLKGVVLDKKIQGYIDYIDEIQVYYGKKALEKTLRCFDLNAETFYLKCLSVFFKHLGVRFEIFYLKSFCSPIYFILLQHPHAEYLFFEVKVGGKTYFKKGVYYVLFLTNQNLGTFESLSETG